MEASSSGAARWAVGGSAGEVPTHSSTLRRNDIPVPNQTSALFLGSKYDWEGEIDKKLKFNFEDSRAGFLFGVPRVDFE